MATIETVHSPIAMMIDIETLGLTPHSYVTQIGICIANTKTREYLLQPVNFWMLPEDVAQEHRDIDPNTVGFWIKQTVEKPHVAMGVFFPPEGTERVPACEVFNHIKRLIDGQEGLTVWASPAMFDLSMLTDLWGSKPWSYKQERDMMTLYKLLDPNGDWAPPENEAVHDAAADARWQMEYLFNLLDLLRNNNMSHPDL